MFFLIKRMLGRKLKRSEKQWRVSRTREGYSPTLTSYLIQKTLVLDTEY